MRTYPGAARVERLVRDLRGTVLDIGAGSGANLEWLPAATEWIGLEPSARARRRLARAAARAGRAPTILAAPAERIPLADASADAVLCTFTLCSVTDPEQALREVRRVLRPGGAFVFHEHVAAPPGSRTRRLQHLVAPVTRLVDRGCDPARETWTTIERAGFASVELDWFSGPGRLFARFIGGRAGGEAVSRNP